MNWLIVVPRLIHSTHGCGVVPLALVRLAARLVGQGESVRSVDLNRWPGPLESVLLHHTEGTPTDVLVTCKSSSFEKAADEVLETVSLASYPRVTIALGTTGSDLGATIIKGVQGEGHGISEARVNAALEAAGASARDQSGDLAPSKLLGLITSFGGETEKQPFPLVIRERDMDLCITFRHVKDMIDYGRECHFDSALERLLWAMSLDLRGLIFQAADLYADWLSADRTPEARLEHIDGQSDGESILLSWHRRDSNEAANIDSVHSARRKVLELLADFKRSSAPAFSAATAALHNASQGKADATRLDQAIAELEKQDERAKRHAAACLRQIADATPSRASRMRLRDRICQRPFENLVIKDGERAGIGCERFRSWPETDVDSLGVDAGAGSPMANMRLSMLLGSFDFCRTEACPLLVEDQLPRRNVRRCAYFSDHTKDSNAQLANCAPNHLVRLLLSHTPVTKTAAHLTLKVAGNSLDALARRRSTVDAIRNASVLRIVVTKEPPTGDALEAWLAEQIPAGLKFLSLEIPYGALHQDVVNAVADRAAERTELVARVEATEHLDFLGTIGSSGLREVMTAMERVRASVPLDFQLALAYDANCIHTMGEVITRSAEPGFNKVVLREATLTGVHGDSAMLSVRNHRHPLHLDLMRFVFSYVLSNPMIESDIPHTQALN